MKRILVVEDEKALSKALQLKLESDGFEVEVADDGEVAVKKIAETKFDLILLDLILPKLDGFRVLEKIRLTNPKLPVFVLSNLGQPEDTKRAVALGATDYYIKSSIALSELIKKVKQQLGV